MKIDEIEKYLWVKQKDINFQDETKLKEILPEGWHIFVPDIIEISKLFKEPIGHIKIRLGLLILEPKTDNIMFKRIAPAFISESAVKCMICGEFGIRRRHVVHRPSLCPKHFIQYTNYAYSGIIIDV